jgi:mRNA-degrading endonuclease RelE of RelBE toxin-antitoxin system
MSEYEFGFHPRASRQAAKLPRDVDERIQSKLIEMVTSEWRDLFDYDVDSVSGTSYDIYRTRIGDYRVFFLLDGKQCVVLHIDQREGAYGNISTLDQRAGESNE